MAGDRRERGDLVVRYETAEPVPKVVRNLAPSSLALLGTALLPAQSQECVRSYQGAFSRRAESLTTLSIAALAAGSMLVKLTPNW